MIERWAYEKNLVEFNSVSSFILKFFSLQIIKDNTILDFLNFTNLTIVEKVY
jgi:hypothetical protein